MYAEIKRGETPEKIITNILKTLNFEKKIECLNLVNFKHITHQFHRLTQNGL